MSMANSAWADPEADKSRAADRVILEAGEIDSSTVPVGSYVVVIHGQGERHPVSGDYEQLVTSRGYVHAVDAEVLTLFRRWDGEPEWIEVDRIQTLVLTESHSRRPVERGNEQVSSVIAGGGFTKMPKANDGRTRDSSRRRIAKKLASGAVWGLVGASVSGSLGGLGGAVIGYQIGTAIGVSRIDSEGSFPMAMVGSGAGSLAAVVIGPDSIFDVWYSSWSIWEGLWESLPYFVGPLAGAVFATELARLDNLPESIFMRRGFLETSRFSVGLMPTPRRGWSAVATLHF